MFVHVYVCACVCVCVHSVCILSLLQDPFPLGGGEGLQLETGLVDEDHRQVEIRVPHLENTQLFPIPNPHSLKQVR